MTALGPVKKRLLRAQGDNHLPPYVSNDLQRERPLRSGSVVLHDFDFETLVGNGQAGASECQAIAQAFGSFDAFIQNIQRGRVGARLQALGGTRA